jgi:hypothetical protein
MVWRRIVDGMLDETKFDYDVKLQRKELLAAIEHLTVAIEKIQGIIEDMRVGCMDLWAMSCRATEAWNAVNQCRIFTETILPVEEVLQPVLGYINDAVQMIDSLITWRLGMTPAAHRSILDVLSIADDSIRIVVDELASWFAAEAADEETVR